MGDERDFRFEGGRPSVDFTATVGKRHRDGGFERLIDPAALGRWCTVAGLAATAPRVTPADLGRARLLREAVYRLMTARLSRSGRPATADIDVVNAWATKPPPALELRLTADGLHARPSHVTMPALLALIARDAVEVIGGADGARLRECDNPECSLLFIDTSRAGARRWCSMRTCGARDKMARYRGGH
ncbi:putative RNA-binding Zn ribbon-like protein [Krasilnikovia cinnamomea]|uniref:Putative RNA-binding Zn ribbon-like protein n=1 Tax=Krasilnikovia cinnamomea TaxID=349313 RepID=A0A4Q7ZM80_9ACTN|nr:ABATE domain-containing protein [Krasilnikovia cinnamomea]RZU52092.1 putative RNA-binding Zn ribbon-like protein [Krasilnikovia cinnamomea]